jgi:hypothetical protein
MTEKARAVQMTVPVTFKIGPVPGDLTSHSQLFTFALAHIQHILKTREIASRVDGQFAIARYDAGNGNASFTVLGETLEDRHYRVLPKDTGGFSLETSTDKGVNFAEVAVFNDEPFAKMIGEAWVSGRAEMAA